MYDVIIIGGGPGGYKTAELCAKNGQRTALIEEADLGGTCLNQGCIPFKTYLHFSGMRRQAQGAAASGFLDVPSVELRQGAIRAYKDQIAANLRQSVQMTVAHDGADLFRGHATVQGTSAEGFLVSVGEETLQASSLVLATGSVEQRLTVPAGLPYPVLYSKEMLELDTIPKNLVIVGGGTIGLEAASFFSDAGSQVTVVESLPEIGGAMDREIAQAMQRILKKKGIAVYTDTMVQTFAADGILCERRGESLRLQADAVLVAIGRKPRLEEASLSALGVAYTERGISVDASCRTNVPGVFACGDVTGKRMLAHTAYRQAKVIADTLNGKDSIVDYSVIPGVTYTNPEVLTAGACEQDLAEGTYTVSSLAMTYSGKYFAENGKDGAKAKLIVDQQQRVIGFHMIGNGASELSLAAELMIAKQMTADELTNLVYAHPTYGEIIGALAENIIVQS